MTDKQPNRWRAGKAFLIAALVFLGVIVAWFVIGPLLTATDVIDSSDGPGPVPISPES